MLTLTAAAVSTYSGLAPVFALNVHYARGHSFCVRFAPLLETIASLGRLSAGHVACFEARIQAMVALVVCRPVIDCPVLRRER